MHRRYLIAGLGAAAAAAPVLAVEAATSAAEPLRLESYLRPVSAEQRARCAGLSAGAVLDIVPATGRTFDTQSLAAMRDGAVLGYLPGRTTRHLRRLVDDGWVARATTSGPGSELVPLLVELTPA